MPDVKLKIAGKLTKKTCFGRYIYKLLKKFNLENHVDILGEIDEHAVASELLSAHVFVMPSFIENNSNSLCEAQLVGVPSIASYVGGIPSLIEHEKTGLFFPPGDYRVLAARVLDIFSNSELACKLSVNSRHEALKRHDPIRIADDVLNAYLV